MHLYRIAPAKSLEPVPHADATEAGLRETSDLETWVRTQSRIFDRDRLLWLSRQQRVSGDERADLLGLCHDELILVELKRGTVEKEAVAQGLSYLAQHAKSDRGQLLDLFVTQAARTGEWALLPKPLGAEEAEEIFDNHTGDGPAVNQYRALLLLGEEFAPETLQVCNLINESTGLDGLLTIECWRLQLFTHQGEFLCAFDKLLPSKNVEDEIATRREVRSSGKWKRDQDRIALVREFKQAAEAQGLEFRSKQGQSYECTMHLPDAKEICLTINRDEPKPRLWLPMESAHVDVTAARKEAEATTEDGYWVVPCPCEDLTNPHHRSAAIARALQLVKGALRTP